MHFDLRPDKMTLPSFNVSLGLLIMLPCRSGWQAISSRKPSGWYSPASNATGEREDDVDPTATASLRPRRKPGSRNALCLLPLREKDMEPWSRTRYALA